MISFGPIPSRRLGKSLGINNILSPKVCTYGCIYCQVGKTKNYSIERQCFFQSEVIFHEVLNHLKKLNKKSFPDFLTFVSNGEPTLDINLSATIKLLRILQIPIAVITNASLLNLETVVNDLLLANWVSVKVDAPDNETWQLINKPFKRLNFETHVQALLNFSQQFKGTLCSETMLIDGLNDTPEKVEEIAEIIKKMNPAKAYLSIPTRPPAFSKIKAPEIEKVNEAWQIFSDKGLNAELLIGFEGTNVGFTGNAYEDILNTTAVHPLREDIVMEILKKDNYDFSVIESLIKQRLIKKVHYNNQTFYFRNYFV